MKQNNLTQGHAETSNSPIGMELYTDALVGVQTKLTELCTKTQTGVTPLIDRFGPTIMGWSKGKFLHVERYVYPYYISSSNE
jgi:hypothetical protein